MFLHLNHDHGFCALFPCFIMLRGIFLMLLGVSWHVDWWSSLLFLMRLIVIHYFCIVNSNKPCSVQVIWLSTMHVSWPHVCIVFMLSKTKLYYNSYSPSSNFAVHIFLQSCFLKLNPIANTKGYELLSYTTWLNQRSWTSWWWALIITFVRFITFGCCIWPSSCCCCCHF